MLISLRIFISVLQSLKQSPGLHLHGLGLKQVPSRGALKKLDLILFRF